MQGIGEEGSRRFVGVRCDYRRKGFPWFEAHEHVHEQLRLHRCIIRRTWRSTSSSAFYGCSSIGSIRALAQILFDDQVAPTTRSTGRLTVHVREGNVPRHSRYIEVRRLGKPKNRCQVWGCYWVSLVVLVVY